MASFQLVISVDWKLKNGGQLEKAVASIVQSFQNVRTLSLDIDHFGLFLLCMSMFRTCLIRFCVFSGLESVLHGESRKCLEVLEIQRYHFVHSMHELENLGFSNSKFDCWIKKLVSKNLSLQRLRLLKLPLSPDLLQSIA